MQTKLTLRMSSTLIEQAKQIGPNAARQVIQRLLHIFTLAPVDRLVVQSALQSAITDFEDAILCKSQARPF